MSFLFFLHLIYVKLTHPEPPAGLLMDQSLQQGPKMQTQSTEEELSSLTAICVMIKRRCFYINLGLRVPLQHVCLFVDQCAGCVSCAWMCGSGDDVFLPLRFLCWLTEWAAWSQFSWNIPLHPSLSSPCFFLLVIGESGTKLKCKPILPFATLPCPPTSI